MSVPQVSPDPPASGQRMFNIPGVVIGIVVICVLAQVLRSRFFSDEFNGWILYSFAFIPARYAQPDLAYSWQAFTSPFTHSFLHGSYSHLINNCLWLVVFGSPLAQSIGKLRFVLFWLVCAGFGAFFHYIAQPQDMLPMIGASGAVSGMMGAAARFGFRMVRNRNGISTFREPAPDLKVLFTMPIVLSFLAVYLIMNFAIGATGTTADGAMIAWQAHIGGIVAGFLAVPLFTRTIR